MPTPFSFEVDLRPLTSVRIYPPLPRPCVGFICQLLFCCLVLCCVVCYLFLGVLLFVVNGSAKYDTCVAILCIRHRCRVLASYMRHRTTFEARAPDGQWSAGAVLTWCRAIIVAIMNLKRTSARGDSRSSRTPAGYSGPRRISGILTSVPLLRDTGVARKSYIRHQSTFHGTCPSWARDYEGYASMV